jgi:hypothetical protein
MFLTLLKAGEYRVMSVTHRRRCKTLSQVFYGALGGENRNLDVFDSFGEPFVAEWISQEPGPKSQDLNIPTAPSSIFAEMSHQDARFLLSQPEYRVPPQ